MTFDDLDKAIASAIEAALQEATTLGVAGFTAPVMTPEQYTPTDGSVAPTLPRDFNRAIGLAVSRALRSQPVRVGAYFVNSLPTPVQGGIIYVHNGAEGLPILAFSDGAAWLRCDTRTAVS